MDVWEETILAWVNAVLGDSKVSNITDLKLKCKDILKNVESRSLEKLKNFISRIIPNYYNEESEIINRTDFDHLCAFTGILIFVSFSTEEQFNVFKEAMSLKLDNAHQQFVLDFLIKLQNMDFEDMKLEHIVSEIHYFNKTHVKPEPTMIGDGVTTTPVKKNFTATSPEYCGSPLMEYFKTPRKKPTRQDSKCMNCDNLSKKNEDLNNQLVDLDHEKAVLEDELSKQTQKCRKFEKELNAKTQQIKELESHWSAEVEKKDEKLNTLHKNFEDKVKEEKRLRAELAECEKYSTNLTKDLSNSNKTKEKIEKKLEDLLERNKSYEKEVTESSLKIAELNSTISLLESQITSMKENYPHLYELDHTFEMSFDRSLDASISAPENMGVVIEKILSERNAECADLKESVEELKSENEELKNKIENLQGQVASAMGEKSDLSNLNQELREKLGEFEKVRMVLEEAESKLIAEARKVDKLLKENTKILKNLKEKEEELEKVKEGKKVLEEDYQRLTEDFKEQLEEVSRLTTEIEEKHLQLQKAMGDFSDLKEENENIKKSVGYVDGRLMEGLEKLEGLIKDSDGSTDSFASCLSVENRIDKLADLLHRLEVYNLETAESRAVLEKTCVQLNESIASLKSEIFEREEREKSSVKKIKDLEKFLEISERKVTDLQESYSSKIENLKKELEERAGRIEELGRILKEEKEELMGELRRVKEELIMAEEKVKRLEGLLEEKEKDYEVEREKLSGELERLRTDLRELKEENVRLNDLLEENREKLGDSYVKIKKLEEEKEKILMEQKNLFGEKEELRRNLDKAGEDLRKLKEENVHLNDSLKENRKKYGESCVEIKKLNEEKEKILMEQKNWFGEKEEKLEELRRNLDKAGENLRELKEENVRLSDSLKENKTKYTEIKKLNEEKEKILMEQKNLSEEKEGKIEGLRRNLEKAGEDLRASKEESVRLNDLLEDNKGKLGEEIKKLHKLTEEKKHLFEEKEEKVKEINNLKRNLEEIEGLNKNLSCELLLTKEKLNIASKKCESLNVNVEEKDKYIKELEDKCEKLAKEKEKTEKIIIQIKTDLENAIESQKSEFDLKIKQAQTEKESRLTEIKNIKQQRDDLLKRLETKSSELLTLQSLKDAMRLENQKIKADLQKDLQKATEELEAVKEKLEEEIRRRSEAELQMNEEKRSVQCLTSEVEELESQRDKIIKLSCEMKNNVVDLKSLITKIPPGDGELKIIYDACKEITESASQFSLEEDAEKLKESLSPQSSLSSFSHVSSGVDVAEKNFSYVEIEMEELNRDIIVAKKSLYAFLQASTKHFEELKMKENLMEEMSKEQKNLEIRISSLTDLNARLTKEISESKSVFDFKEKELECLKAEVESVTKASGLLKEKLANLEKVNEILLKEKEGTWSEISKLREENRTLTNDIQNRVTNRLRQQNLCLGLIRNKEETELELERVLTVRTNLDKKIADLRKTISGQDNKSGLDVLLMNLEQKFYQATDKVLHLTYMLLKWGNKNLNQRFSIINGDELNDSKENLSKEEEDVIKEKFKLANEILNMIGESVKDLESKTAEKMFSDSLEEISIGNRTFDIVNLDENVNNKTFSIDKNERLTFGPVRKENNSAAWVVSPPSKTAAKPPPKFMRKKEKVAATSGESWVVPMDPPVKLKKAKPIHRSAVELSSAPVKEEKKPSINRESLSKSSSLSEIDYSPPNKKDSKISESSSFASCDIEIKKEIPDVPSGDYEVKEKNLEKKIWDLQKEILEQTKEKEKLKSILYDLDLKRKKEKEAFEKSEDLIKQKITAKYEAQLDELKAEMKSLYNKEMAKHKAEQGKLSAELLEQNKTYKEHIDELRNQNWHLGEKLYQERKLKDDSERKYNELKKKFEKNLTDQDSKTSTCSDFLHPKDCTFTSDVNRLSIMRQLPTSKFPTMPTEDEDEVFDNRRLEDLKAGICQVEDPETRLSELKYRNSLCLPHLKSSYPAETQFHNPKMYKENELKFGNLNFGQESASLTDSDHSMTKSLLPDDKTKKKDQTSYKRPGPPTPSKNGGRLSLQSGDLRLTPRNILKEQNDIKGTPSRLKMFFTTKNSKRDSIGVKDENSAPVTPRGKKLKLFKTRKPFGVRDF